MQGTLEAVHAQLLYRIRMTGQSSPLATSQRSLVTWMKIESTFIDIEEDALEEGWTSPLSAFTKRRKTIQKPRS